MLAPNICAAVRATVLLRSQGKPKKGAGKKAPDQETKGHGKVQNGRGNLLRMRAVFHQARGVAKGNVRQEPVGHREHKLDDPRDDVVVDGNPVLEPVRPGLAKEKDKAKEERPDRRCPHELAGKVPDLFEPDGTGQVPAHQIAPVENHKRQGHKEVVSYPRRGLALERADELRGPGREYGQGAKIRNKEGQRNAPDRAPDRNEDALCAFGCVRELGIRAVLSFHLSRAGVVFIGLVVVARDGNHRGGTGGMVVPTGISQSGIGFQIRHLQEIAGFFVFVFVCHLGIVVGIGLVRAACRILQCQAVPPNASFVSVDVVVSHHARGEHKSAHEKVTRRCQAHLFVGNANRCVLAGPRTLLPTIQQRAFIACRRPPRSNFVRAILQHEMYRSVQNGCGKVGAGDKEPSHGLAVEKRIDSEGCRKQTRGADNTGGSNGSARSTDEQSTKVQEQKYLRRYGGEKHHESGRRKNHEIDCQRYHNHVPSRVFPRVSGVDFAPQGCSARHHGNGKIFCVLEDQGTNRADSFAGSGCQAVAVAVVVVAVDEVLNQDHDGE
mmetsp:Transcript_23346/g.55004  ORF Transcript_23346/g.55004 Transcript_23346/m.55004 type:complete len:551 (-) Transcript_23346:467-2119(-)